MTRVAILTCKSCSAKYNKMLSRGGHYRPKLRPSSMELCPDCLERKGPVKRVISALCGKKSPGETAARLAVINGDKEPIEIAHADLEHDSEGSYKSACPVCKLGTLLVRKDPDTLAILSEDSCILCAQRFIYTDLGKDEEA